MDDSIIPQDAREDTRGGGQSALVAGLLLPGGGQFLLGDWRSALCVLFGVAFLTLTVGLELTVPNYDGYPAPFLLPERLAALTSPIRVVPQLVMASVFAVALHVGAAMFAARAQRLHSDD